MEDSGLCLSMLSPFCDDLPEFDSEGPEFPPVEELNCDPYSPAYTDAIFQALDLDGPVYFNVDGDIMKRFKELICQYPTAFSSREVPSELLRDLSTEFTQGCPSHLQSTLKRSLLYLPTQIRFLIGGERVTCHWSKLNDALERTKLNDALGKQHLELWTCT